MSVVHTLRSAETPLFNSDESRKDQRSGRQDVSNHRERLIAWAWRPVDCRWTASRRGGAWSDSPDFRSINFEGAEGKHVGRLNDEPIRVTDVRVGQVDHPEVLYRLQACIGG